MITLILISMFCIYAGIDKSFFDSITFDTLVFCMISDALWSMAFTSEKKNRK